ncbi:DUF1768-domain-containing protein [Daedalea quercina L-15889]|uniref:DUF1768-domain-containing protein n=1 Tax=Daedalea quercina L-15889 TaxID=1314783 RepID=A0A165LRZ7_9APHY|nr:DUF1768-domain-containing protein [Daedalea quercina L-15889]
MDRTGFHYDSSSSWRSVSRPTTPSCTFPQAQHSAFVHNTWSSQQGRGRSRRPSQTSEPLYDQPVVQEPDRVVPPRPRELSRDPYRAGRSRSYSQPPPLTAAPSGRADPVQASAVYFYDSNAPYYEFTNFASYAIHWDGHMYPSAEHLFQAHKFMPHRPDIARRIRRLPSSRAALEEAGNLRSLQRADWLDINIDVMDNVLEAKFAQHLSLRHKLLETGNSKLIEDSPIDPFWGCGRDRRGRNELGKALMRLRDKFQKQLESGGGRYAWTTPPQNVPAQSAGQMLTMFSPFKT